MKLCLNRPKALTISATEPESNFDVLEKVLDSLNRPKALTISATNLPIILCPRRVLLNLGLNRPKALTISATESNHLTARCLVQKSQSPEGSDYLCNCKSAMFPMGMHSLNRPKALTISATSPIVHPHHLC